MLNISYCAARTFEVMSSYYRVVRIHNDRNYSQNYLNFGPETLQIRREITGKYATKIVINHAHTWN
jgi:glycerol-3-phosphate O-acyltransferase